MKILMTGGAGYIGTVLTAMLLDRGDTVRCFDALTFGVQPVLPFFRSRSYELVQGDIRDEAELRRNMRGVDAIIHLAAIVGYPACAAVPEVARDVNTVGTQSLNRARSPHQPVLAASTGSVYGAVESERCTEETPINPLSVYARTKADTEQILLDGGQTICYRFATAFGLSPRLRLDLLVNDLCFQAVRHGSIIMYEPHFQRTFIHVHDIARAFVHALDNFDAMRDQVFNCGDPRLNASKLEVAQLIMTQHPYYLHLAETGKDSDARNYEMSYDKVGATGFEATVSLDEGIGEMVRAFRFLRLPNPFSNAEAS